MSDTPTNGPDPETLKRLHESLPGFVKQAENKQRRKGLVPVSKLQPSKCCRICGTGFDRKIIKGSPFPELAMCPKCAKLIKQGYQAIVADNRYAFVKSESLKKGGDDVIECSPVVFDKLQVHYNLEWSTKAAFEQPDNVIPLTPPENPGNN